MLGLRKDDLSVNESWCFLYSIWMKFGRLRIRRICSKQREMRGRVMKRERKVRRGIKEC